MDKRIKRDTQARLKKWLMSVCFQKENIMKKKRRDYSKENFTSLDKAYSAYQRDRLRDTANPALAPKKKFASIWGWRT